MSFISDEEMLALPDDPAPKFVALERLVRVRLLESLEKVDSYEKDPLRQRYMGDVHGAAVVCDVAGVADWKPSGGRSIGNESEFLQFQAKVDFALPQLRLKSLSAGAQFSVNLDEPSKMKLRRLLDEIRETVDHMDISEGLKERLFSRINALQREVDLNRTRYESFAALYIAICQTANEGSELLEPVVRQIERVGRAIGIAKETEDEHRKQLPSSPTPKRIEDKRDDPRF